VNSQRLGAAQLRLRAASAHRRDRTAPRIEPPPSGFGAIHRGGQPALEGPEKRPSPVLGRSRSTARISGHPGKQHRVGLHLLFVLAVNPRLLAEWWGQSSNCLETAPHTAGSWPLAGVMPFAQAPAQAAFPPLPVR